MNDTSINIRMIQHFMYCPRRYALLEINKDWNENAFVVSADIMHERVHDGSHSFSDRKKTVRSAVSVYNDLPEYDLYGITDCVEFIRDENGVEINGLDGRYNVHIVEYKPKAPKGEPFHETDAIQVFAQKICADFVWKCSSEAFLYYADTRKRVPLPFDDQYEKYDHLLKGYIGEMREILRSHRIPQRKKGQKCSGCSIADLCFPKESRYNVKKIIMDSISGR
ncbi:MAG: CRISPR-associated protein Cas4 [Ruminococcus sp.]